MPRGAQHKDHTLSIRLADADLGIIDRAAELLGCSRKEFIRNSAVRAAEDAIIDINLLRVSPEAFSVFIEMLDAPAKHVPALVELMRRPAPWETGNEQ